MKKIIRNVFCIASITLMHTPMHSSSLSFLRKNMGEKLSRAFFSPQGRYFVSRKPEAERRAQLDAEMAGYRNKKLEEHVAIEKQETEKVTQPQNTSILIATRTLEAAGISGIFALSQITAHNLYFTSQASWQLPNLEHTGTMTALCFGSVLAAAYVHEQLRLSPHFAPHKDTEIIKPLEQIKKRPTVKNR